MTPFSTLRQQAGLSIQDVARKMGFDERTVYRWERGETLPRRPVMDQIRSMVDERRNAAPSSFTFIDLFAGIGGLRRGFEPIGGKCVFTSEWDRYSQKTYRANFPGDDHPVEGDIREIGSDAIPAHDLLLAGFPCQPFSIAGVSKKNALSRPHGFACEAQGTLFFDVARIIRDHRPKAFLLENVKNLVNHDRGHTFRVIHDVLTRELGYHVEARIVDARSWVPQHRERIFIIGFREKNAFSFDDMEIPDPLDGPKLGSILHRSGDSEEKPYTEKDGRVSSKYTLSAHLWNYLQEYAEKHRLKGNGFGFGLFGPNDVARTLSARYYKDGSEILIGRQGGIPRRLTPRECARLMGFDAPGRTPMIIPVSDTQAYRQFGNAVVVPVVETVARHMQPFLLEAVHGDAGRREKAAVA
ncbi:DNA (cytosine-5-)-methyltransferase [Xanthobacter autotrophicus]|uniref:DNA (cytosine-5-)-methyltransferase n=1 Tax=Xanthobacter TaxID=279 RepID=UPI0024AC72DE|nr:DNA (cytosine-5-)-methyltransferase [Xanthobacter autotrophicus]MDI4665398.1 DNA (cytosine-5-)-methyltransferase [Xanthobacter autotrophicus]